MTHTHDLEARLARLEGLQEVQSFTAHWTANLSVELAAGSTRATARVADLEQPRRPG
ncbi:hypothetical protein [Serinicoccus kebangsaanensis]|uniref:hypothetical protein n=1 Tax=Serinicoccus kebangsaanensis TaxID=2602069 RepID=UPI00178C47FB|nr:hypothetical protein [Serinicoccus kebangsaanensis]